VRHSALARLRCHSVMLLVPWVALLGCDNTSPVSESVGCPFVVNLALLSPSEPRLHIGDTVTMHVKSWAPVPRQCLPPDTTAAGLRWWTANGVVAIDSMTGHMTALRPGSGAIVLLQVGVTDAALGSAGPYVFEPPGADSVVTIIRNRFGDSARVTLRDANGTLQRSQTVAAGDSTCWVTSLSDSLRYSAIVYVPPPTGPDSASAGWITASALAYTHTFQIVVYPGGSGPAWQTVGVSPDPGTGC
jgi:hypothetical protein